MYSEFDDIFTVSTLKLDIEIGTVGFSLILHSFCVDLKQKISLLKKNIIQNAEGQRNCFECYFVQTLHKQNECLFIMN